MSQAPDAPDALQNGGGCRMALIIRPIMGVGLEEKEKRDPIMESISKMMGHLLEDNANHRAACNAGVDEWPGWALTCRVARPTMQSAGLPSPVLCSGPASFLYPRSRQTATTHMPFPVNSGSFWLWSH
ncbi:hypothetical protein PO909_024137 [Leuciscus waleckii]